MKGLWEDWSEALNLTAKGTIDAIPALFKTVADQKELISVPPPFKALIAGFAKKRLQFEVNSEADLKGLRISYYKPIHFLKNYFEKAKYEMKTNKGLKTGYKS